MLKLPATLFTLVCLVVVAMAGCGSSSDSGDDTTGSTSTDGGHLGDATVGAEGGPGAGKDSGADAGDSGGGPAPACVHNSDCASKVCSPSGTCAAPTCNDGAQNASETDTDCGGGTCPACDSLKDCALASDCTSGVCATGPVDGGVGDSGTAGTSSQLTCQVPTDIDGVKNGNETGTDCGGMGNPTCAAGQGCAARTDCTSDVCTPVDGGTGSACAAAVCDDGQKNGTETGVDCGGASCPSCGTGLGCLVADDCQSQVCKPTAAGNPLTCQAPTYSDMVKNGTETDVDCGGTGSTTSHACPAADKCLVATDCQSDGCDYNKRCAIRRSCVGTSKSGGHYGADTCGAGGDGIPNVAQAWESCCTTVPVTVTESGATQTIAYDKYRVTAGRFRAFLEAVSYDVRDFVGTARTNGQIPAVDPSNSNNVANLTVLDSSWDAYLPTSLAGDPNETADCENGDWDTGTDTCKKTYAPVWTSAANQVGATIFKDNTQPQLQGCSYSSPGTHTYYLTGTDDDGTKALYAQSDYDERPIQCVDYLMAQAFCVWDGGRLQTTAEWAAAWGPGSMPWGADTTDKDGRGTTFASLIPQPGESGTYSGCRYPSVTDSTINAGCPIAPDAAHSIELADYEYSYQWPVPKSDSVDFMTFIAAPGRMRGRAPNGAADIVGGLLEMTSDIIDTKYGMLPYHTTTSGVPGVLWAGNGSWEVHDYYVKQDYPGSYGLTDKYGKQGLRCVHTN